MLLDINWQNHTSTISFDWHFLPLIVPVCHKPTSTGQEEKSVKTNSFELLKHTTPFHATLLDDRFGLLAFARSRGTYDDATGRRYAQHTFVIFSPNPTDECEQLHSGHHSVAAARRRCCCINLFLSQLIVQGGKTNHFESNGRRRRRRWWWSLWRQCCCLRVCDTLIVHR